MPFEEKKFAHSCGMEIQFGKHVTIDIAIFYMLERQRTSRSRFEKMKNS